MKKTIMTSTLLIAILVASIAFAKGPGKFSNAQYNGYDCPGRAGYTTEATNLTQEQTDQITALHQKFTDETYDVRLKAFQKSQEMRMMMETSTPDAKKLKQLSAQISDLEKQLRDKMIDLKLEIKKIAPELSSGNGFHGGRYKHGRGMWSSGQGQGCPRGGRN